MMGNQYKKLFDSVAPIKSDEELLKAVLARKAEKNMSTKKKFNKAIVIPAAAAALLGTTAIGVSAAYQWDLSAAFEDMFRGNYNDVSDRHESAFTEREGAASVYDFNAIGKELNKRYEYDGFDVILRGIITDSYSVYVVADVEFKEGFDYEPKGDHWSDWDLFLDIDLPGGGGMPHISDGNRYTFYHECHTIDNTSIQGKTINISASNLFRYKMDSNHSEKDEGSGILEREDYDLGISLDVDLDFDVTRGNKSASGSEPIYLSTLFGSGDLTDFTVTPLGINATIENSDIEEAISIKAEYNDFDLVLYHSDRTSTTLDCSGRLEDGTLYISGDFEYPIDTSDIVEAKIGNVMVDLSNGTFKAGPVPEKKVPAFDFSSVGTEINKSYGNTGYTLTLNGVAADAHTAYFIYTIEFNDRFLYDYKHTDVYDEGWFDWTATDFTMTVNGEEANIGYRWSSSTAENWLDENTLCGSFMISYDDGSFENSDISLNIGRLERHYMGSEDTQQVNCDMTFDFSLGDMTGKELILNPDETFALDGIGNVIITEVKITPFKLTYTILPADGQQVEFEKFCGAIFDENGETCVTLENGTKISAEMGTGGQKDGGMESFMEMSYPVNPSDIASVTVCGHEIAIR